MKEIRLQKYFTDCGVMSRRAAENEIAAGNVKVNGVTAHIGQKIDPDRDTVEYKGKSVVCPNSGNQKNRCTYILLYKPIGYVTTMSDEKGRLTVVDLVKGAGVRVYPVGRLDMYSEGLLIMTNDGELANMLTHPSHCVSKTYIAEIPSSLTEKDVLKLSEPIEINGYFTKPAAVRIIKTKDKTGNASYVEFILYEGRNRQIRRICERSGYKITKLTRTKIGKLEIGNLTPGKWRYLSEDEINYLKGIEK